MRRAVAVAAMFLLTTATATAQSAPPASATYDAAQQVKLRADVGTWQCVSDPASSKPEVYTETEEGNWFVTHAGGDTPRTSYERWSHTLQTYIFLTVFDSGASDVEQSTSPDPDNGTWTAKWPALDNQGRKRFDVHVARTGDVIRASSQFYDAKGNVRPTTTTCTKQ
jgi:hypothetical protein